jgi:hypothetical protein
MPKPICFLTLFLAIVPAMSGAIAQSVGDQTIGGQPTPIAATAATVIPALIRYAGIAASSDKKPQASATFLIFKDESGGEPLWSETQTVAFDAGGHYDVYLGATGGSGLPLDLFATGEARWLEVQIAGEKPQTRVLLTSVPYAIKASDAATLGGLPASAFALAGTNPGLKSETWGTQIAGSAVSPDSSSTVTTPGGTKSYIPIFTGANTIADSEIYDTGTSVGIGGVPNASARLDVKGPMIMRGSMTVSRTGNATSSKGYPSYGFDFYSNAYNSSTKATDNPYFQLQSEPSGNNTSTTGATFNLLYANHGATPAETGFSINSSGVISFASGQTFGSTSSGGVALNGTSTSNTGVEGTSSSGSGVVGTNANTTVGTAGVLGVAGQRNTSSFSGIAGVWGDSSASVGVFGSSDQSPGVFGQSNQQYGVSGASNQNNGVYGTTNTSSPYYAGVWGSAGGSASGLRGEASGGDGVFAESDYANGVEGHASLPNAVGVVGDAYYTDGLAGQFNGNLVVTGTTSTGSSDVKIDHPADPANKYLVHTAIESSEMVNIYSGNVTTDELGLATVRLPDWFELENGDFRYQLTVLNQFAQAIIKNRIANHQFIIMTNAGHVDVSWQVTGVRQDAFAKAHPLVVEEVKPPTESGYYLRPELHGQPEEKGLDWARNPDWMRAKKTMREMQKARASDSRSKAAAEDQNNRTPQ